MTYGQVYYRDRIVLNPSFLTERGADNLIRLGLERVPKGATLLLAAREIKVEQDFQLNDYNLVLLADRFDGSSGSIKVQTTVGVGENVPGIAGPSVTIVCRQLAGLSLTSIGGKGGVGSQGAAGEPGFPGADTLLPGKPGGRGGPGGKGGTGGMGAMGGSGGELTLIYIADQVLGGFNSGASLHSLGGPGGDGGPGGPGGLGGEGGSGTPPGRRGPKGDPGDPGPTGSPGSSVAPSVAQVSEAEYWQRVVTLVPLGNPEKGNWAAHRLRAGEYFFRKMGGALDSKTDGSPDLTWHGLALSELNAVLQLEPANEQARLYREHLLNNQNILGLERDLDVIPDFEAYESTVARYRDSFSFLFGTAGNFLLIGQLTDQLRQDLDREVTRITGMVGALDTERQSAVNAKTDADQHLNLANQRVSQIQRSIQERREELENKHVDWGGVVALGMFTVAVGVISFATGGAGAAALLPYAPDLLSLGGLAFLDPPIDERERGVLKQVPDVAKKLREIQPKGLKDFESWKKVGSTLAPVVISFYKIIEDLNQANGDAEMINLLKEATELTQAQLVAQFRSKQADLALQATDKKLALAKNDLRLAEEQRDRWGADQKAIDRAASSLIRYAQKHLDMLNAYAFKAARAVEIYTLRDLSDEIHYDYGYIHPDIEQDYLDGFRSRAELVGAYSNSYNPLFVLDYRRRYDAYFAERTWTHDSHFRSFTDPAVLAQFRQSRTLGFTVELTDLPQSRYEAKITAVHVSLVGATATAPKISCLIEHSGRFVVRKFEDAALVSLILEPKITVVEAMKSPGAFSGVVVGANPRTLAFWGRGIASAWTLWIESDEIDRKNIDLAGLSRIEVEIEYDAFLKPEG
jgi:hypothetical protein